ncbi:peptidylprolyl isomerase [Bacillus xiamenensis]|uniref:peptidylprolyl isomerase n=1 Tax=Bacillus xiamenensis TaxID=1178537 RepID=A0AAC9NAM4_9BACI|nr:peptidylprolyl isomerase [Bacillus xiamenensis]
MRLKARVVWTFILVLLMINAVVIAYVLTKSQMSQASSSGKSGEEIASIGKEKVTRQEWLKKMEDRYGKATLEQMINQKVVNQLAKENKLEVSSKEINRELLMLKAVSNNFYEDGHTSEKEWKEQIRYQILLEQLLTRDAVVSEKEAKSFYEKNKDLYQYDDSYRIRHIVVKTKDEAESVLKDLKGGSSFEAVAAERSIDRYTSPYGGDLGFVTEEQESIPALYIQEAQKLQLDEWTKEPIKIKNGYAIIQLKEKLNGRSFSYKEVKDQIKRQIAMEDLGEKANVKTLWKEANVTWFYDGEQD